MSNADSVLITNPSKEVTFQEELAEVYFSQKSKATTDAKLRLPIKRVSALPFFLAGIALIAVLAVLMAGAWLYQRDRGALRQSVKGAELVKVIEEGRLNKSIAATAKDRGIFPGLAERNRSSFITLGGSAPKGNSLAIDFKFPIDLSGKGISFVARGTRGGEELSVTIRDSYKRSFRFSDIYLESKWLRMNLPLTEISGTIDMTKVEQVRIEYEAAALTAEKSYGNQREAYVKDVSFVKNRR